MTATIAKVDSNQKEIVAALRQIGCTVQCLHAVGQGCPDLLVGYRGYNYLLEVKQQNGTVNDRQCRWHTEWRGNVAVIHSIDEALEVLHACA